ncbi:MAG: flagellar export protein FliJ [Deltaproteobacteria bacterium]
MNRFVFKLEPLLEYKNRVKEIAGRDLSDSQRTFDEAQARLSRLCFEYERIGVECERLRSDGADMAAVSLCYDYLNGLKHSIESETEITKAAEADLEKKRDTLLETKKETMSVESLKERKRAEYGALVSRAEQKASDEVASAVSRKGGRL